MTTGDTTESAANDRSVGLSRRSLLTAGAAVGIAGLGALTTTAAGSQAQAAAPDATPAPTPTPSAGPGAPGIRRVQKWLNETYRNVPGYLVCPEDGIAGEPTRTALTMGVQHELGVSPLVDEFEPALYGALSDHGEIGPAETNANLVSLAQGALICKGYAPGALDGNWGVGTVGAVHDVYRDLSGSDFFGTSAVGPKLFRALLSDASYILDDGSRLMRGMQQFLNERYGEHPNFFYIPCDGYTSWAFQDALVMGLQHEIGFTDAEVDGQLGGKTLAALQGRSDCLLVVGARDTDHAFVRLFRAAMVMNGVKLARFTNTFDKETSTKLRGFQSFAGFVAADRTGKGDPRTWAELLNGGGDPSRPGTAADLASTITPERAQALAAAGYTTVGRYLTNYEVPGALDKAIKPGELKTIVAAGLRVFPIFEEGSDGLSWFSYAQGEADGIRAHEAAAANGFPRDAIIYFAVDVAVPVDQVRSTVVPYFRGIQAAMNRRGTRYATGVYGTRYVCTALAEAGLSSASFVAGMSFNWAGNPGYPLPENWAFNQIGGLVLDPGGPGAVTIDKNVMSGRDFGSATFLPAGSPIAERVR